MKKNNFKTISLSEVCHFQRGLTYSKKDEVDFSSNIVLRANNVSLKNNLLDLSSLKYISDKVKIEDNKKVRKGSLLMCTASGSKSHLGKIALIDKDYGYAFGGFMGQLIPNNNIDSKYLFYVLISDSFNSHLSLLSSGANINNLKFSDIASFKFSLPDLSEQKRIVKILDETFEQTRKLQEICKKKLDDVEELKKSVLESLFKGKL